MTAPDNAQLKREAAVSALDYVEDGMKLGLGTGSTADLFIELIARRILQGLRIQAVPTSERTARAARAHGIPLFDLDAVAPLDLTIDGTDEADRALDLVKGAGGALLREKIVAASSKRMVVIADASKLVQRLGRFPLPIEVVSFGHGTTASRIAGAVAALGYGKVPIVLREKNGAPVRTDTGNQIYDCHFGAIADAPALASRLSQIPGVVEHGLFIGIATTLLIAGPGGVETIERR
ncbi:MAG: ribose-5-phosphate isomerase RpiA [Proteobacteria bacterium]|nr:ribose-5-phosphate isomerase RpiA [Pseudomonadota bacterium]MBI3499965.1 ribose-5-phosphate isomerase RpiA [Pseudomonadota bacterium]